MTESRPLQPEYCSRTWMGYRWSAWMPLMAAHPLALAQLPSSPGLYRIRRASSPHRLEWIGWAERGVRETVERLSRQVHMPVQPYDDPDIPALALWRVRQLRGAAFEISGAPLEVQRGNAERCERQLRAAYRVAAGEPLSIHSGID